MHPEWHILICQGLGYHSYEFVNQEVILLTTQLLFALAMNLLSLKLEYGYLVNTVWVWFQLTVCCECGSEDRRHGFLGENNFTCIQRLVPMLLSLSNSQGLQEQHLYDHSV